MQQEERLTSGDDIITTPIYTLIQGHHDLSDDEARITNMKLRLAAVALLGVVCCAVHAKLSPILISKSAMQASISAPAMYGLYRVEIPDYFF